MDLILYLTDLYRIQVLKVSANVRKDCCPTGGQSPGLGTESEGLGGHGQGQTTGRYLELPADSHRAHD